MSDDTPLTKKALEARIDALEKKTESHAGRIGELEKEVEELRTEDEEEEDGDG
jgi:hypothetical protein